MKRLMAVVAVMAFAAPAQAGWQFTRWGMTVDEVRAAAPAPLADYRGTGKNTQDETARLTGTYTASTMPFATAFRFNNRTGGLATVELELTDTGRCAELWRSMQSIYGEPLRQLAQGYATTGLWRDEKASNQVSYLLIGSFGAPSSCSVTYSEIKDQAASGL